MSTEADNYMDWWESRQALLHPPEPPEAVCVLCGLDTDDVRWDFARGRMVKVVVVTGTSGEPLCASCLKREEES